MTISRRDRWLARYAYATLNTSVGAIAARSRDRVARLLGAATLSKGGGVFTLTLNRQPITLNGQVITLREAA